MKQFVWPMIGVVFASCASKKSAQSEFVLPPLEVLDAPIAEIVTPTGNRATATFLGNGVWITNRHVLGDSTYVTLDGVEVVVEELAAGISDDEVVADWVAFKGPDGLDALTVDFKAEVVVGSPVYIVGFGQSESVSVVVPHLRSVVRASVADPEAGSVGLLSLLMPERSNYYGLSGSPVMWVHPESGRVTVIGVYAGRARCHSWGGLIATIRSLAACPDI